MPEVVSKVELTEGEWQSSGAVLEVGGKELLQTSWAKVTVFLPSTSGSWSVGGSLSVIVDNGD